MQKSVAVENAWEQAIQTELVQAVEESRNQGRSLIFSTTVGCTFDAKRCLQNLSLRKTEPFRSYWRSRGGDEQAIAWGVCRDVTVSGTDRFAEVASATREVSGMLTNPAQGVQWFGGFSFACGVHAAPWTEWPDSWMVLPSFVLRAVGEQNATLTVNCVISPEDTALEHWEKIRDELQHVFRGSSEGSEPEVLGGNPDEPQLAVTSQEAWEEMVSSCSASIRAGDYEKVVLARCSVLKDQQPFSIPAVVNALETRYPDGYVFAFWRADQCFIAASPERLAKVEGGKVLVDGLAGTAPRGKSPEEDQKLGEALRNSSKNRHEHALVVNWILRQLTDLVHHVEVPSEPRLWKLANVQHLHTPVQGQLLPGKSLLDIVARLHPTPAVAGVPRARATEVIQHHEWTERGWYAGAVGWFSLDGDGEFAVGLRSALVSGCTAYLYAGAGIMGDSEPTDEWQETELKLAPMRGALTRNGEKE